MPNRWGEGQEARARLELYGGLQKGGMSMIIIMIVIVVTIFTVITDFDDDRKKLTDTYCNVCRLEDNE